MMSDLDFQDYVQQVNDSGENTDLQIIDLHPVSYYCLMFTPGCQLLSTDYELCDLDASTAEHNVPGDSFLADLFPDETLYSRYLNGLITFDDLMREMHRKETCESPESAVNQRVKTESDQGDERSGTSESSSDIEHAAPRRKCRPARGRRKLPVELAQYLGEAERCLNNNQFDEAENICRTIIEAAPNASAPYVVLAEVNYRRGDQEKANEFLFAAAQRSPTDTNLWTSLIDFAEEKDDLALAMYYTRLAVRSAKQDITLRRRLIQYCERAGRSREALILRLTALSISPEPSGEEQFRLARSIADEFFKLMDYNSSIRAYESAFEAYPTHGTDADKNTVLSILLQQHKYEYALRFFLRFCGVTIRAANRKSLRWDLLPNQLKRPNRYTTCKFPDNMPPELYLKLFLVMVHLKLTSACMSPIRSAFTDQIADAFSDWLLDIIKSYRVIGLHAAAGELLLKLTHLKATKNMPHVWIMLAETQIEHGQIDTAIQSYRYVVDTLAPRHAEARLALSNLLKRVGRHQEALDMLKPSSVVCKQKPNERRRFSKRLSSKVAGTSQQQQQRTQPTESPARVKFELPDSPGKLQTKPEELMNVMDDDEVGLDVISGDSDYEDVDDFDDDYDEDAEERRQADAEWLRSSEAISDTTLMSYDPVAYRIAFERCRMLDHPTSIAAFMDEAWNLLFTDVARLCGPDWARLATFLENTRLRSRLMSRLGTNQHSSHNVTERETSTKERNVSSLDIWSLFLRLVEMLMVNLPQSLSYLQTASIWGCLLPEIYNDEGRRMAASNLLISSCILGRHGTPAFIKLKDLHKKWAHKNQYWNILNMAVNLSKDYKHCRYLDRLVTKDTADLPVGIMANNDFIVRGSYRFAIARLIGVRNSMPNDPLLLLLLAVSFLGVSAHKHAVSRHPAVLQALGFLSEYRRVRGHCQEVYYNIARACHQLMLGHIAVHYYEKVLTMEPVGETEFEKSLTDLRQEAAFNLVLIYRAQGNFAMAHHMIQTYLVF
ncbi:hypothetical protein PHET_06606 [Paragonimus heterotremus]|uniref:General transcription factor 3C polypeptide 3 n=1 Tax=Paragonimus heterotremus TaxID=100268 RepID=A0A8J4SUR4_9TREM|nr:hypothetical protein PHET_06606 [Paragonimus heterotremus]